MWDNIEDQKKISVSTEEMNSFLHFVDVGCTDYKIVHQQQKQLLQKKTENYSTEDVIIFCSHPPVVTCGRSTTERDIFSWKGDVFEIERGGRATYHGPNQLVIYPIVDLSSPRIKMSSQSVPAFLNTLEQVIIDVLKQYDIVTTNGNSAAALNVMTGIEEDPTEESEQRKKSTYTGVWVGPQKIASIGIAIKKWVSYHGIALNVDHDPKAFEGINPCGFTTKTMTSMEEILGEKPCRQKLIQNFQDSFKKHLA